MNITANNSTTASTFIVDHVIAGSGYLRLVSYVTNIILSLPTNVYVLWLIVTGGKRLVTSDFFALNLSVSEILCCLCLALNLLDRYVLGRVIPYAIKFAAGLVYTGRPLFQSCICVERYLAVVHPVVFLKYRPLRYKIACSGLAWLLVLGSCLIVTCATGNSFAYFILSNTLVWFFVKLFCCLAVLRALKRPGPGEGDREREGTNNMKMKAFKIILIILVTMVITYLPMIVSMPMEDYLAKHFVLATAICFSIIVVTGFVQPLLYLHRSEKLSCIRGP